MRQTCHKLLQEYKERETNVFGEKLLFSGVEGKDVYNITAPFSDQGRLLIAGRVEERDTEHSQVMFFQEEQGVWHLVEGAPRFRLQDPFVSLIGGELVLGGVEVYPHPIQQGALGWRTNFYRGSNINTLKKFATGPDGMKDIRLVELVDGRIGVFTRPQGVIGGRGQIGFTTIDSLSELAPTQIGRATLLEQFDVKEWGGVNEVHLLSNGTLGVLGHIACFDQQDKRHYYPMVFNFDPDTGKHSPIKLLLTRDQLAAGDAKRPDLVDVIFSGGLVRLPGGKAMFYAGVSDCEAHKVLIDDPFLQYEAS